MRPAPRRPTVGGSAFASKIERLSLCNSLLKRLATPCPCGARSPDKKESQLTVEEAGTPLPLWRKEPRQEGVTTHCHCASSHCTGVPMQGAIRAASASL